MTRIIDLENITTNLLVEELKKREGVKTVTNDYMDTEYKVYANGEPQIHDDGIATILVVVD